MRENAIHTDIKTDQLILTPSYDGNSSNPHLDSQTIPAIQPFELPSSSSSISSQKPEEVAKQSKQLQKKTLAPPKQILEMEERARARKDKRDQLKKTYEEK
jgi:hypothetical protein